jgi:hypothetical protein
MNTIDKEESLSCYRRNRQRSIVFCVNLTEIHLSIIASLEILSLIILSILD